MEEIEVAEEAVYVIYVEDEKLDNKNEFKAGKSSSQNDSVPIPNAFLLFLFLATPRSELCDTVPNATLLLLLPAPAADDMSGW